MKVGGDVGGFGIVFFCLIEWGGGFVGAKEIKKKRYDGIDRAILGCYTDDPHMSAKQVALKIGVHFTTVYEHIKRPVMKDAITEISGSLEAIIADAKRMAAKKMKRLIMSDNEHISLKASTELLKADLSGETNTLVPVKFITVVNEVGVLESMPTQIDVTPKSDV